jgi:hypothetical protein
VHVFDMTPSTPKLIATIKVRDQPGWITWSLDGSTCGRPPGDRRREDEEDRRDADRRAASHGAEREGRGGRVQTARSFATGDQFAITGAMKVNRREALQAAGAAIVAPGVRLHGGGPARAPRIVATWIARARKLADPVLTNPRAGRCTRRCRSSRRANPNRRNVTHLEAFGRLLAGIAPWIETGDSPYRDLALQALARAVDPASPDVMNFTRERQPLVDAAFLAQGLLRAPTTLLGAIDARRSGN